MTAQGYTPQQQQAILQQQQAARAAAPPQLPASVRYKNLKGALDKLEMELKVNLGKISAASDVLPSDNLPQARSCALIGSGWQRKLIPISMLMPYKAKTRQDFGDPTQPFECVFGDQANWVPCQVQRFAEHLNPSTGVTEVHQVEVALRDPITMQSRVVMIEEWKTRPARLPARAILGIRKAVVDVKYLQRLFLKKAYPQFDKEALKKALKKEKETGIKVPLPAVDYPLLAWAYKELANDDRGDPFVMRGAKWNRATHRHYAAVSDSFAKYVTTAVVTTEHIESSMNRLIDPKNVDPMVGRCPTSFPLAEWLIQKKGFPWYQKLSYAAEAPKDQEDLNKQNEALAVRVKTTRREADSGAKAGHRVLDIILLWVCKGWYSEIPDASSWYKVMRSVGLCESLQPVRVHTFLNRILGLPLRKQREVFTRFHDMFEIETAKAIQSGAADQGMCELDGEISIVAQAPPCQDQETGAHTKLMTLKVTQFDKRMPWEMARDLVEKSAPSDNLELTGIYRTVRSGTTSLRVITKEEGSPAYLIYWMQNKRRFLNRWNPHTTRHFVDRSQKLTMEEAEPCWGEAFDDLAFDQDQTADVHVIMGPVLASWAKLRRILGVEGGVGHRGSRLVMKFVNEVATDGTRIIGILVPPDKVYELEEAFTGFSLRGDDGQGMGELSPSKLRSGLEIPAGGDGFMLGMEEEEGTEPHHEGLNADGSWGPDERGRGETRGGAPSGSLLGAPGMDAETAAAIGGGAGSVGDPMASMASMAGVGVTHLPPPPSEEEKEEDKEEDIENTEDEDDEEDEEGEEEEEPELDAGGEEEEDATGGYGESGLGRMGDDAGDDTGGALGGEEEGEGEGEYGDIDDGVGDDEAAALLAAEMGSAVAVPPEGAGADDIDFSALEGIDL